jgi:hypothetical protein
LVTVGYGAVAGAMAMAGRQKVKGVGAAVPETLQRFKSLFTFRTQKIKGELSDIPQQAFSTLSTVKEDVQEAWQRGSRHQHENWR